MPAGAIGTLSLDLRPRPPPAPRPTPCLPTHAQWGHVLGALRYVVIDEAHMYRGIFGAHVALVLRRLRRLAAPAQRPAAAGEDVVDARLAAVGPPT